MAAALQPHPSCLISHISDSLFVFFPSPTHLVVLVMSEHAALLLVSFITTSTHECRKRKSPPPSSIPLELCTANVNCITSKLFRGLLQGRRCSQAPRTAGIPWTDAGHTINLQPAIAASHSAAVTHVRSPPTTGGPGGAALSTNTST